MQMNRLSRMRSHQAMTPHASPRPVDVRRRLHRVALGVALGLGCASAFALCDPVTFTPSTPDVGTKGYAALPPADSAGYKLVGRTAATLRAVCDDTPATRQINFTLLVPGDDPGLVKWSSSVSGASNVGAAKVVINQATVGGYAVPMTFTPSGGATLSPTLGPVTLNNAGMLRLDLNAVPGTGDARKTVVLDMQVQTMVKTGYAPSGSSPFRLDLGATLP